ncbi:MAG: GIY-YIG nuclease family protein, partial [Ramlibacter sp.]
YGEEHLLKCLALLALHQGRLPTFAEIKLRRRTDKDFPSHGAFSTLGGLDERISKLHSFAERHAQFEGLLGMLPTPVEHAQRDGIEPVEVEVSGDGHVYMLKLGKHYKIGRTYAVPRRHREISLELPEKPDLVHAIRTDDPEGIELYWHRRFSQKQTNGEWFALNPEDVRAFKRRKFM